MKLFKHRYVYEVRNVYVAVTRTLDAICHKKLDAIETKLLYILNEGTLT